MVARKDGRRVTAFSISSNKKQPFGYFNRPPRKNFNKKSRNPVWDSCLPDLFFRLGVLGVLTVKNVCALQSVLCRI